MGDVMIGRLVNERLSHVHPSYIWGDLLPLLKETDINLANLETTLTKSRMIIPKVFNFKADPEKVRSLQEANINIVNLANNHILDYSTEGLQETIATLDKAGILHVGAGSTEVEAKKPAVTIWKEIRIGVLGCTDNEPTWKATDAKEGTVFLDASTIDPIKQELKKLRAIVDILILSIHWGPNMKERPSKQFIQFAHQAIDCGVDIIHGHSAHIFQGIEFYHGGLILYDTGDFIDDYAVDPLLRNDRSFFFIVEAGKEGVLALYLIPTLISDCQVNMAVGTGCAETMQRVKMLSKEFNCPLTIQQSPFPHLFLRAEKAQRDA